MRKIVQIAARAEGDDTNAEIYALCDDGTLWAYALRRVGSGWGKLPDIPQDQPPAKEAE